MKKAIPVLGETEYGQKRVQLITKCDRKVEHIKIGEEKVREG
jgi:hypothetical protein